jgi:hypothetical protein
MALPPLATAVSVVPNAPEAELTVGAVCDSAVNVTFAVPMRTGLVGDMSVAVYVTVSPTVSATVNVTTPLEFVVAGEVVITDVPEFDVNVIDWFGIGYGAVLSRTVTVIVAVAVPFASTGLPVSTTVEFVAEGGPVTVSEYA